MNILQSALGHYEPKGSIHAADIVVGHSFGTLTGTTSANRHLAEYISEHADGRPILVDHTLAEAFPDSAAKPDKVVGGPVSTALGGGTGTWGTLLEAQLFMNAHELSKPLMVAQAFHIGRVAMQAEKLHMNAIIPDDLPTNWDPESEQYWTRSRALWIPREVIGSLVLKATGRL